MFGLVRSSCIIYIIIYKYMNNLLCTEFCVVPSFMRCMACCRSRSRAAPSPDCDRPKRDRCLLRYKRAESKF